MDFSSIDAEDPCLDFGHRLFYDREVPIEVRSGDGESINESGKLEAIRVKILVTDEHAAQSQVRMELRCESDLFFIYIADVDESHYAQLQDNQKLMVTFQEFPSILVRMLNNCIKEPHSHLAVFVTSPNAKHGRLDFIQNMDYKFVELLSLKFSAGSEDYVKRTISFRYNAVKSKFALMQSRLSDVNALVKLKNPGLLLQLQRSAAQSPAPAQPSPAASRSPSMINKSYLTPPRRPGTR